MDAGPRARALIDRGGRANAGAIVAEASLPQHQVWARTLDIWVGSRALDGAGPAEIVVGAVAALALITVDAQVATAERARRRS